MPSSAEKFYLLFHISIWTPLAQGANVPKQSTLSLSKKLQGPTSQANDYIYTHMSVAIVRATRLCLREQRVLSYMMIRSCSPFEDRAGISLHKNIPEYKKKYFNQLHKQFSENCASQTNESIHTSQLLKNIICTSIYQSKVYIFELNSSK